MTATIGFVARLLDGDVPPELEAVFQRAGVALLPHAWRDLRATCGCPDPENPCKHIAAVLYVFADRLDADPWLLLQWRGRSRDEVLAPLRRATTTAADPGADAVAPWWPFAPGRPPRPADTTATTTTFALVDADPADVLDQLAPLDVVVAGRPIVDLIRPTYGALAQPADPDDGFAVGR
jgi:uncharacterized Zn finger protein